MKNIHKMLNFCKFFFNKVGIRALLIANILVILSIQILAQSNDISSYNVVWESPSADASGQMPFGNGDVAAGVYAIENGDLYLLLAKNDALTHTGDIFKTGRVRISISPNPFISGKSFQQILDMETGSIRIEADGIQLKIWADANRNVYHIEINSPENISIEAQPEFWERFEACGFNNFDVTGENVQSKLNEEPTQDVLIERNGNILWYYAV